MIGVGEAWLDGARHAGRGGAGARRARAGRARRRRKAWRCSTARSSRPRYALRRPVRGRARCSQRRWSPARCRPTRRAAPTRRSIRASTRCAAIAARSTSPRALRALMAGSAIRASHLERRSARAGPLLPALPAAGDGRLPRPAAPGGGDARRRGQRRLRQSADLRRGRRGAVGRQLPRRAGRLRRRHDRARGLRDRLARRAAHRHAGRSGALRPAGVPDAAAGPQLRLHDRRR